MKTNIFIIALALLINVNGKAQSQPDFAVNTQNYHTAVGLRFGGTSGLTIKQFLGQRAALEGIIGVWHHGLSATLLFEQHAPTRAPGLNWYYGAGGHVAFDTGHSIHYHGHERYDHYRSGEVGLGIDGVVGLEYKIRPIPLAVSLDMKPFFEITSGGHAWMSLDPSIGVKLAF